MPTNSLSAQPQSDREFPFFTSLQPMPPSPRQDNHNTQMPTNAPSSLNLLRRLRNRLIAPVTLSLEAEIAARQAETESLKKALATQAHESVMRVAELTSAGEIRIRALEEEIRALTTTFATRSVAFQEEIARLVAVWSLDKEAMQGRISALTDALTSETAARKDENAAQVQAAEELHAKLRAIDELRAQLQAVDELRAQLRAVDELRAQAAQDTQNADALLYGTLDAVLTLERPQTQSDTTSMPRVSIIMPVRNRPGPVREAIASLQAQCMPDWEAIVISDGSTDDTEDVVERMSATDPRIRLLRITASGVCAARNEGLAHARADIVAYLDSDNRALPNYLSQVVNAFDKSPATQSVYAALVADTANFGDKHVLWRTWDREKLIEGNFIDLNVFAHRRALYIQYGGFDNELTRLVDWDLILRYTEHNEPVRLPIVGVVYRTNNADRITRSTNMQRNRLLIYRKWAPRVSSSLRVLVAVQHYSQLLQEDTEAEIRSLQRAGATIECWSKDGIDSHAIDYAQVHQGSLESAAESFSPAVLHAIGSADLSGVISTARAREIPVTLRTDRCERNRNALALLSQSEAISRADIFPHQVEAIEPQPWIHVTPLVFDSTRVFPPKNIASDKDSSLVIQVVTSQSKYELDACLQVAERLPSHRFILLLESASNAIACVETLKTEIAARCPNVELHIDLPSGQRNALMAQAGLCLESSKEKDGPDSTPAGPSSAVVHALACGTLPLVHRSAGFAEAINEIGIVYDDVDSLSARIAETQSWDDATWLARRIAAIDLAFERNADDMALRPLFDAWCKLAGFSAVVPVLKARTAEQSARQ